MNFDNFSKPTTEKKEKKSPSKKAVKKVAEKKTEKKEVVHPTPPFNCKDCEGVGLVPNHPERLCPVCNGTGRV